MANKVPLAILAILLVVISLCLYKSSWKTPRRENYPLFQTDTKFYLDVNKTKTIKTYSKSEERLQHLKNYCNKEFQGNKTAIPNLNKFLYHPDDNASYCGVPKVATSTLFKTFARSRDVDMRAENNGEYKFNSMHASVSNFFKFRGPFTRKFSLFSDSAVSFLFTRHPITRIVSCYKDKVANKNQLKLRGRIRENWERKPFPKSPEPGFSDFLDVVASSEKLRKNGHIKPITETCFVCNLNFTFLGKLETFQEDWTHLLEYTPLLRETWQTSETAKKLNSSPGNTVELALQYMSELNDEQLRFLEEFYSEDFKAFGYSMEEYLKSEQSTRY